MTEGVVIKTKRNGARIFKNPPQPHMCIQDYMQGSELPCYVNVLSWDKVTMHYNLYQNVPLYGGMRVSPPRGEKAEVGVFAVIANPELLKLYGKNAKDPKERTKLIEELLDFVETKNEGVYFSRQYTILKDKDITGELKEVWMAVQAKRDRENLQPQQETWIDAQPPAPQYPQYSDQQQTHQQQLQTAPQQQQHVEYAQPPQYRSNAAYSIGSVPNNEIINHEREIRFNYQQQNPIVSQGDQICMSFKPQDRCYSYLERNRPNVPQNPTQQNCPAYPVPQYQFQQLPRQMVPQFVNSNMHISPNPIYNMANQDYKINLKPKFYEMKGMQQQETENSQSNNTRYDLLKQPRIQHRQQFHFQIPQPQIQQQIPHQIQQHQVQQHQIQQQQIPQLQIQQQQIPQPQIQQQQIPQPQVQQQQIPHQVQQPQQQQIPHQVQQPQQQQNPHQIQIQQPQIQEMQSINYQQPSNQQYQRQTQQQHQSQSENHVEVGDTRSKSNLNSMKKTMRKQYMTVPNSKTNKRHDDPQPELSSCVFHTKGCTTGTKSEMRQAYGNFWLNQQGMVKKQLDVQQQDQQIQQQQQHPTLADTESQFQLYQNDMTNKVADVSKRTKKMLIKNQWISPRKMRYKSLDKWSDGEKGSRTKCDSAVNSNDQDEGYHQAYTILKKPEASTTSGELNVPTSSGLEDEIDKKLAQISIEDCKDATEVNAVLS